MAAGGSRVARACCPLQAALLLLVAVDLAVASGGCECAGAAAGACPCLPPQRPSRCALLRPSALQRRCFIELLLQYGVPEGEEGCDWGPLAAMALGKHREDVAQARGGMAVTIVSLWKDNVLTPMQMHGTAGQTPGASGVLRGMLDACACPKLDQSISGAARRCRPSLQYGDLLISEVVAAAREGADTEQPEPPPADEQAGAGLAPGELRAALLCGHSVADVLNRLVRRR